MYFFIKKGSCKNTRETFGGVGMKKLAVEMYNLVLED